MSPWTGRRAPTSNPANVATPPGETPGKKAKEKNAKENAEEKRKKKGCQQRHRVELNPLKAEADLRSLWNSEKHTKEQACEVLAKLVAVTSRAKILHFPPWCKKSRFS